MAINVRYSTLICIYSDLIGCGGRI